MSQLPAPMDSASYRRVAMDIAAPVAIVTAMYRGRDYAATVSSFTDVSYDPPTMLISLFEEGRIADAVAETGHFTISVLTQSQERIATWLGSPGNPVEGVLTTVPMIRGNNGLAIIDGALAAFECVTVQDFQVATHRLFAGEVTASASYAPRSEQDSPLIHFAREFRTLK